MQTVPEGGSWGGGTTARITGRMLDHRSPYLVEAVMVSMTVMVVMVMMMVTVVMIVVVVGMDPRCYTLCVTGHILLGVLAQISTGPALLRAQLPSRGLLPGFLAFLQRNALSTTHITVGHILQMFLLFGTQIGKMQQLDRDLVPGLGEVHLLGTDLVKVLVDPDRWQRANRHSSQLLHCSHCFCFCLFDLCDLLR